MGIQTSTIRHLLSGQQLSDWCLPLTPYIPFPKDTWMTGQDGLLTDIHILPERLQRSLDNGNLFWWCDAQFVPFKDTYLLATTAAFQPRANRKWAMAPHIPQGKVLLYHMASPQTLKCNIYSRTNSSVIPKLSPHPLGQMVAYCGTGEVVVMTVNGDPVYSQSRDLTNAVHVYCAIANNGISFACLKRGMGVFFLECSTFDLTILGNESIRCHHLCPGFIPSNTSPDNVVCKFSPDSKMIAISSNKGLLFIVKRIKLEKFCFVCPDMVDGHLSSAEAFDFHPRFPYEVITLATRNNNFQTINIETGEIILSRESEQVADCLIYSRDGLYIAVGCHSFDIHIYDSADLSCTHVISMSNLCQAHMQRVQEHCPTVFHLSFSQNGVHLASTSCDGHLRLWRIPRMLSLQEICRDKILACLPVRDVKKLKNFPEKMKNFLLYKYF